VPVLLPKQLHLGGCRNAWKNAFRVQKETPVKLLSTAGLGKNTRGSHHSELRMRNEF